MPVTKRKFVLEAEMTVPARNWLEFQGFRTKSEFRTPSGICDLVGVKFSKNYIESRLSLSQARPVGNPKRVALLECIPSDRPISLRILTRKASHFFGGDEIRKELQQLETDHFIHYVDGNLYQRQVPKSTEKNLIIAVEIKLDKIEEVFFQARSNLAYAHKSYLGMPIVNAERLASSTKRDVLVASGVGLLSVERGRCEVLIESSGDESQANPAIRGHCLERFWRSLIGSTA
jgi:hypothetical protein